MIIKMSVIPTLPILSGTDYTERHGISKETVKTRVIRA